MANLPMWLFVQKHHATMPPASRVTAVRFLRKEREECVNLITTCERFSPLCDDLAATQRKQRDRIDQALALLDQYNTS